MRKAQTTLNSGLKFGLKLASFAALAASLSSCFLVITDGSASSDISNVRAQATYCSVAAGGRTNLDFEFNVNNSLSLTQIEVAFLLPPEDNFIGTDPVKDNGITDPLASPNTFRLVSTTIIGSLTKSVGGRTYRATAALEVIDDGNGGSTPTVINGIQAQAIIVKASPGRVWVRGTTASGFKTAWAKANAFTEGSTIAATCDTRL
jgi:hypothetical protein